MKNILFLFLSFTLPIILTNCALTPTAQKASNHEKFTQAKDYPATNNIYKNESLLAKGNSSNTSLVVDLSDQRIQLLVDGEVALDSPTCTGRAGKRTPTGTFYIKEKIKDKRSTIFGKLFKGSTQVYGGDRRKYKGSYTRFLGSPLPYWMRLTGDGIGIHYSANVKRYPASAGCIRTPMDAVTTIYYKVRKGTKVVVRW